MTVGVAGDFRHGQGQDAARQGRRGKAKSGKAAPTQPPRQPTPRLNRAAAEPRPPGQRFYDLPYSAAAPRLINPDLGLHNLVARAGHNAAYEIDVTLLDAPDHRLIRSGVLLAHRVLDGRGEWFMTAPDWQPLLPKDRIELMGHADLPEEFADLLRPLRRRATLGPVAALNCDRREFALRDDQGTTLALLRDDKVTVRRGGLTTARYREVMITPIGPGLDRGAGRLAGPGVHPGRRDGGARFPRLVARLGRPGHRAHRPARCPSRSTPRLRSRRFVSQLLALRLRRIVEADLAIRGGDQTAVGRLADEAARLRDELAGWPRCSTPDWVEDLVRRAGLDQPGLGPLRPAPAGTGWPAGCAASATSRCWNDWSVPSARRKLAEPGATRPAEVLRELISGALRPAAAGGRPAGRRLLRRGLGRRLAGDRPAELGARRGGPGAAR